MCGANNHQPFLGYWVCDSLSSIIDRMNSIVCRTRVLMVPNKSLMQYIDRRTPSFSRILLSSSGIDCISVQRYVSSSLHSPRSHLSPFPQSPASGSLRLVVTIPLIPCFASSFILPLQLVVCVGHEEVRSLCMQHLKQLIIKLFEVSYLPVWFFNPYTLKSIKHLPNLLITNDSTAHPFFT